MLSPRRIIPPAITRHNIPRRPRSSRRNPGLIFSSRSQGMHAKSSSSVSDRLHATHMGADVPAIMHVFEVNLSSSRVRFCQCCP